MGQVYNTSWEQQDIRAVIDGCRNWGVKSGLGVTESSPAAMSVLVGSGSCCVDSVIHTESSAQNVSVATADLTHPRKDIVIYDTVTGNPAVITGTPAAAPVAPDIPADDIYLGMVQVAANATSITNTDIDEGRVYVDPIPTGIISMWHGLISAIPTGYLLCDGTNGTPDLRARFVRGAAAAAEAGTTGGADTHTLTIAEMPAHTHNMNNGTPGISACAESDFKEPTNRYPTSSTGGGGAHNNLPSFYEILYIMKT